MTATMTINLCKDLRDIYYDYDRFDKELAKRLIYQSADDHGLVDVTAFAVRNDNERPYKIHMDLDLATTLIDKMDPEIIGPDALIAGAITKAFISQHNRRDGFSVGNSTFVGTRFDEARREIHLYASSPSHKLQR